MTRTRLSLLLVAVLAAWPAAAQKTPQVGPGYRMGAEDLVKVDVVEAPSLATQARVSDAGTLEVPVLGAVQAAGLTPAELEAALEQRLEADYLEKATVRVQVLELRSQTVTVIGAVANPGSYGYPGGWTLLEAISAAGGLTAERGDEVRILRRASNGLSDQVSIPLDELISRTTPKVDLPVFADDVINVEKTHPVTIYLLGEAAKTGAIPFKSTDRVSLLTVIASVGGLSDRASPHLQIKRRGADGKLTEIEANYKRILEGRDPDVELRDGDIVVVKESFF